METLKSKLGIRVVTGIRRAGGERPEFICGEKMYKVGIGTGGPQGGIAPGTGTGTRTEGLMADTGLQSDIGVIEEETRRDSPPPVQGPNGVLAARRRLRTQKGEMIMEKEEGLSHLIDTTGEIMSLRIGEDMGMRISEIMSMIMGGRTTLHSR